MKTTWKYLKYLLWFLAPVLIVAGLTAGVVSGSWGTIPLGLLSAGIVALAWWLLFEVISAEKFWARRSTEASTNALISALAVLLILGLINFLGIRYQVRIDLTENQLFTLAPQTQEILQNLQQPVKVWVFSPQPNPQNEALLQSYQRLGGEKFRFEFVDPQARPGLAQEFGLRDFGDVYLEVLSEDESSRRREFLGSVKAELLSESRLTNTIQRAIANRATQVYFLQGHGEHAIEAVSGGLSQAVRSLRDKNYIAQPLNLAERSEVPQDADVVVVAGPKRALFESEVEALRDYLVGGGSLLLMLDPGSFTRLDPLLREWGVKLDNRFAVDATGSGRLVGLGPAEPLISRYGEHPIARDFRQGYSFYPLARPLEITEVPGVEAVPLLITADRSWAESDPQNQTLEFDPESDRQGPLILGVALTKSINNPDLSVEPTESPSPLPAGEDASEPETEATPTPESEEEPSPNPEDTYEPETEETPTPEISPEAEAEPSPTPEVSAQTEETPTPETSPESEAEPSPTPEVTPSPIEDSRMVVLGDSDFATDGKFEQQLNGDVFLNSISWLAATNEETLSIRPKQSNNRRILMSEVEARYLGWTALLIVPLFGFATAGIVWFIRR